MTNFDDVGKFHDKFGLDNVTVGYVGPREWNEELMYFRLKFLLEELDEFTRALEQRDHAEMADALVDLVYVAMGTAHLLGYPWEILWDEVQAANMRKIRAKRPEDSRRGSTFDVVKPPDWKPPRIKEILESMGWDI